MRLELEPSENFVGLAKEAEQLVAALMSARGMVSREVLRARRDARRAFEEVPRPDVLGGRPARAMRSLQVFEERFVEPAVPIGRQRVELLAEELLEPLQMEVLAQHVGREQNGLLARVVLVELFFDCRGLRDRPAVGRSCAEELEHQHLLRETF